MLNNLTKIKMKKILSLLIAASMFSTLFAPVAFANHNGGYCYGEPNGYPYSTTQTDCEGAANGGAGTWEFIHNSLAGGPITLNVVENGGNADLSWNDLSYEDGYQILRDNGIIGYADVGVTAHTDNGSTSGDYEVKGIQYDPVYNQDENLPLTGNREWVQSGDYSSFWNNYLVPPGPYNPSAKTSDYVIQLANFKLGATLPVGSSIHVLNPDNFYKVGYFLVTPTTCNNTGTCTVTVHGYDDADAITAVATANYMEAGDTPLFYLRKSGEHTSYRTTIASAPFAEGTTKTISSIEPRLFESMLSNTATLGGGGTVPEFSDYMLMLTFLFAGYAIYNRMPELQKIVAKK